jgi:hypothetical protein
MARKNKDYIVFEAKKGAETLLSLLAPQKVSSLLLFSTYLVM